MAIVYNGTKNSLGDSQLPAGYVKPVVVSFADHEYNRVLKLNVPKADVENANPVTTMQNILADAETGINKQITDILAADYLASASVVAYGDLVALENNIQSMAKGSPAYTDAAVAFVATVNLYVKAA